MNLTPTKLILIPFLISGAFLNVLYGQNLIRENETAMQHSEISSYIYLIAGILFLLFASFIIIFIIRKHFLKVTSKLNILNQELTESILKTQLAIKTSNLIQWSYDCSTRFFTTLNEPLLEGKNPFTFQDYLSIVHPDDLEGVMPIFHLMHDRIDRDYSFDVRVKNPQDGGWLYVSVNGTPIKDKKGKVVKYTGFRRDNTSVIQLTEQLKERNMHIGMALQTGYIIPAIMDTKTDMVTISSLQRNGQEGDIDSYSITFENLMRNIHPNDREKMVKMFEEIKNGAMEKGHEEVRYNISGDSYDNFDVNYTGINYDITGKPHKIVGYFQNITKRKQAEIQVIKQKEFMSNILDLLPIPIHIKDMETGGKYVYWNRESEKMFGEGLFKYTEDIILPESVSEVLAIDKQVYDTELPYVGQESIHAINGKQYETIVHKNVIYNGDRKLLLVARWDIGYQNELYRKSKILSISMNTLNAYTWYCDLRDGVLRFGEGLEQTGASPTEMNSMYKFAQKIHPAHRENFLNFMDHFCKQDSGDFSIEYEIDLADKGNYEWWECRGVIEVERKENTTYKYIYGMDINIHNLKKSEQAILKTKMELDSLNKQNELILNNTNSGLVFLDNDYVVQWENLTTFLPGNHLTRNYKKGNVCYRAVKGLDGPCSECVVEKSRRRGERELKEMRIDNGTLELTATPVFNKENESIGTVLKIVDITEKKKINQELEDAKDKAEAANLLMLNIFDRLPCMLFIKDVSDNFRYIIANNYFCNMLGKSNDQVVGQTDFDLFEKEEAEKFRSDDTIAVREISPYIFEEETCWQGKHTVWQTTKALIEAINGHQLMIALSLDLTEKIDAYNELQEAKERAEQSNKLKSAFLANMSHEIRTPLNAIVGFSSLMTIAESAEEKAEYSNIINTNNELLLRLIGDILDLSKIEAGMLEFKYEQFDVAQLFDNLTSTLSQRITSPCVEFICENPYDSYMILLDKNRFTQVISNFATNAIKFTPSGFIKMGYALADGGIKVYVSDSGIGIAEEKIEKVFERFEKLDDFAQGTGLGMAICKAITEASNGKIGVESHLGKGSTFWAWFPC